MCVYTELKYLLIKPLNSWFYYLLFHNISSSPFFSYSFTFSFPFLSFPFLSRVSISQHPLGPMRTEVKVRIRDLENLIWIAMIKVLWSFSMDALFLPSSFSSTYSPSSPFDPFFLPSLPISSLSPLLPHSSSPYLLGASEDKAFIEASRSEREQFEKRKLAAAQAGECVVWVVGLVAGGWVVVVCVNKWVGRYLIMHLWVHDRHA